MRYDSYKDSEIQWIGEVPHHWVISKLKYVSETVTGNTPPTKDKNNFEGGEFLWVKPNEINGLIPTNDTNVKLTEKGKSLSRVVPPYSVFVNGIGNIGEFGHSEKSVSTNQQINSIVFNEKVDKRYGLFYTSMMKEGFVSNSEKVVVSILSKTKQENLKFVLPPLKEQNQIVSFLDSKTSIIDSLIEKTLRKIELLNEQRISLINEVVTKGLNPNVEMKNSGIEWISEIPSNWEIKKLKYLVKHIKEKNTPGEEDIKISPEYVESDTGICFNQYSEHSGDGYKFIHGDILLNKLRIYLKKFLLVDFEGYSIGEMIVLRTEKKDHSEFIFNCLFSDDLIGYLNSLSTGVKVPRVSPDEILSTKFPLPPTEEISKINEFIKYNNVKIYNQISIEEKRIKLLKEYKQSLISEVVLGKKRVV